MSLMAACRSALTRRLPAFQNPVYRLEMRRIESYLGWTRGRGRPSGIGAQVARSVTLASAALWPLLAAGPYLVAPLARWLVARRLLSLDYVPYVVPGAVLLLIFATLAGAGLSTLMRASGLLGGERDRGGLEPLLLTRLGAADVLLGKAAAAIVPAALSVCIPFAVWMATPPIRPGLRFLAFHLTQSPRLFLACLWSDALALAAAGAFAGLAVAARCRSHRSTIAAGALLVVVPLVLGLPLLAHALLNFLMDWGLCGPPASPGAGSHLPVWGPAGAVVLVAFAYAQCRLDPMPVPVRPIPFCPRVRVPAGAARVLVGALLAAAVGAFLFASGREVRGILRGAVLPVTGPMAKAQNLVNAGKHRQALAILDPEIARGVRGIQAAFVWDTKSQCHRSLHEYPQAIAACAALGRATDWALFRQQAEVRAAICCEDMGRPHEAIRYYRGSIATTREMLATYRASLMPLQGGPLSLYTIADTGHRLAALGDRDSARAAYELVAYAGDTYQAPRARQELTLLTHRLELAPRPAGALFEEQGASGKGASRRRVLVVKELPGYSPSHRGPTLEIRDIILRVDGEAVDSLVPFMRVLARHRAGQTVPIDVKRKGKKLRVPVRLARP